MEEEEHVWGTLSSRSESSGVQPEMQTASSSSEMGSSCPVTCESREINMLTRVICLGFLLLHSVLEDYIFLEICPFHSGFHVSWHIVVCSNFL